MRPIKTQKQLEKRIAHLHDIMDRHVWWKTVDAINEYLKHNPEGLDPSFTKLERFSDSLCLKGAWIYDRVQSKICVTHNPDYKGSLTKKIRKALGFNL